MMTTTPDHMPPSYFSDVILAQFSIVCIAGSSMQIGCHIRSRSCFFDPVACSRLPPLADVSRVKLSKSGAVYENFLRFLLPLQSQRCPV
jgi:hypothetical protein